MIILYTFPSFSFYISLYFHQVFPQLLCAFPIFHLVLTYSGGTDRPGELCYIFSISNDLTQMLNFPTWIPDCDSHSPALLELFLLTLVFVLQWLSLNCKILIMFLAQFPLTFHPIHNGMPHFISLLVTILVLIEMVFVII